MNLYYALTSFHQLECVLHKLIIKPDETAHLYLSSSMIQEEGQIERLRNSGLFKKVVIMDDARAWQIGSRCKLANQGIFNSVMDEISKLCMDNLLLPITKYDNLYIFADHFPFGFVLAYKNIPYIYFEEATGAHSRRQILLDEIRKKNEFWYLVFEKLGARGEADCIIEKNIDLDFQLEGFSDSKAKDFSVTKLLKQLSRPQINQVLSIFGKFSTKDISIKKKLALILTQHYAAASITTYKGQWLLYALLMDYFANNHKIIIKPHPTDRQGIYHTWFPNSKVLERGMPVELLPYCFNQRLDITISATSSSAYNLKDISNRVVTFESEDNRFDKMFYGMHRYYVATQIILQLCRNFDIYGYGADMCQINNFLKINGFKRISIELKELKLETERKRSAFVIIDSPAMIGLPNSEYMIREFLNSLKESDVVCFIDFDKKACFYTPDENEWALYTVPIMIEEINLNKDKYTDIEKEWIYLYTKNNFKRRELLTFQIDKMLHNTGIKISVKNAEEKMRENILEGFLNAAEEKTIVISEELKHCRRELNRK